MPTRPTRYQEDFCKGGAAGAVSSAPTQYAKAQKEARANRALGTGTSLSLAQE